jgi:hypothetical protein
MTKISKILSAGAVALAFGVAVLPAATYASSYDDTTNTLTAANDTAGWDLDYASGQAFLADPDTALTVSGATIDDVRSTLIELSDYMTTNPGDSVSDGLIAKLAAVTELNINISGDAEIIPNDLGYLNYLISAVGNTNDPTIDVNVAGKVSFGDATTDYIGETIASLATSKMTISATQIELPAGADEATFFGAAAYNGTIISGATGGGNIGGTTGGGAPSLTSPATGQAGNSATSALALAAAAVATIGAASVVLRRMSK